MKTFKQFLTESPVTGIIADIGKYISMVGDGRYLVRGVRNRDSQSLSNHVHTIDLGREGLSGGPLEVRVFKTSPRKDRRPLSSDEDTHEYMDEWFKEKFGIAARSSTVFALKQEAPGDFGGLITYGIPTIIALVGDFDYIWSAKYDDLFFGIADGTKQEVYRQLEAGDFRFNTDWDSITPRHEVMVNCDSYYIFVLFDGPRASIPDDEEETLLQNAVTKFFKGE